MLQTIINTFRKPKDFYDLDFILQANGFSELDAELICAFIDAKGRTDIAVRKSIGKIANRGEMSFTDVEFINKSCKHFELYKMAVTEKTTDTELASIFLNYLLKASKS